MSEVEASAKLNARGVVGDRVIHIGAPKCGSTALQSAFHQNREGMKAHGVGYVGAEAHWIRAAKAAIGAADRVSGRVPPESEWRALVGWTERITHGTALISSEWFASAKEDRIERIARDLDRERLHAVLVIRPLTATLPSAWQQQLKLGGVLSLDAWLNMILNQPDDPRTKRLWQKHRYDEIARRWAKVLGPERLSVIVANDSDPAYIFEAFGELLNLPTGTLAVPPKRTNPSLSAFEADTLAELNKMYFEQGGTVYGYRSSVLLTFDGYVNGIRQGPIQKSVVPLAVLPVVMERNAEIARGIKAIGCQIIGDIDRFASPELTSQSAHGALSESSEQRAQDGDQRAQDIRSAAGMMYSLMVTSGIAEPLAPLPGFGRQSVLYKHQALSLARSVTRSVGAALRRRLRR